MLNDKLMLLERVFLLPQGLPDRLNVRNSMFSPSIENSYGKRYNFIMCIHQSCFSWHIIPGCSGLDARFWQTEKSWEERSDWKSKEASLRNYDCLQTGKGLAGGWSYLMHFNSPNVPAFKLKLGISTSNTTRYNTLPLCIKYYVYVFYLSISI